MQLSNKTFDEISAGDSASVQRSLQARDVRAWAAAFGGAEAADGQGTCGIVTAALSSLVESRLPGPGSSVRSIAVQVQRALPIGVPLTVKLVVREKQTDGRIVRLDGQCADAAGEPIATAVLEVTAPTEHITRDVPEHRLDGLLDRCHGLKPMLTGIVHPCSAD